jgi:hypothetical protein
MNLRNKLLAMARQECKESNVRLYLGKGKSVRYANGISVNGFFDFDVDSHERPTLACSTGKPNWELVLVHELNHLRQWREDCKVWRNYKTISGNVIDNAISGRHVDSRILLSDAKKVLLMEHDCEKRSYATLKQLGYSKEKLIEYVQKANAYALFYLYVAKNKTWYEVGKEPYSLKTVWGKFPKTFDIDIAETFEKVGHLYAQCCKVK